MSNDFPPGVRILADDEDLPAQDIPEPPTEATRERWFEQVIAEEIDEHPAFKET